MKLNVYERLVLLGVIPGQGDLATLRILFELRMRIAFPEQESEALNLRIDGAEWKWNKDADQNRDIEIGPRGQRIIIDAFEALDKNKALTLQQLPVYERFIQPE